KKEPIMRCLAPALTLAVAATLLCMPLAAQAAPPQSLFLEDYTTFELKAYLAHGRPVALIFNAGVEESGPHLALGKHIFRARAYAERIAAGLGDTLVAPIIPFAINGPDMNAFPGTISLEPKTFTDMNEQVARSMIRSGFKVVALLGDHGGGQAELADLAKRLDKEFAASGVRIVFVSDSYAKARKLIEARMTAAGKHRPGGHGGLWDTAETLAIKPDAVRPDLFPKGPYDNPDPNALTIDGVAGSAEGATAALGREFGTLRVELAIAELRRDLASPGQ
ncbi:MAG: creatininase family protein, partial [bacterium]|nr:creatininase family protein [bacterium]